VKPFFGGEHEKIAGGTFVSGRGTIQFFMAEEIMERAK
jgi:hypothetical protein